MKPFPVRAVCSIGVLVAIVMLPACGTRLTRAELAAGNGIVTDAGDVTPVPSQQTLGPEALPSTPMTGAGALPPPPPGARAPAGNGAPVRPGTTSATAPSDVAPASTVGRPSVATPRATHNPAASNSSAAAHGPLPPLVLGTYGTESGLIGANVVSMPAGLHAWLADVNARGGISGRKVQIIFGGDDQGDPSKALAITQKLVEQDHVAGLIGTYDPAGGSSGTLDYIDAHHIPVIGDVSGIPSVENDPNFFSPQTGLVAESKGFDATFAAQESVKKIAIVYLGEATAPQSAAIAKAYAPTAGLQLVYSAQVSIAQPSFTAEVLNARNAGAEGVILIMDYSSARRFVQGASQQGWHPPISGGDAFDQPIPSSDASLMDGLLAYSITANFQGPATTDYRAAMARYNPGGALGFLGPVGWAAGKSIEQSAAFLGDGSVGPAELRRALLMMKPTNLNGYVPQFSFANANGHPYTNSCVQPTKLVGGQWTTVGSYACVR